MEAFKLDNSSHDFDVRYTYEYSMAYYLRHKKGFFKVLSNYLEQRMLYKALRIAKFPTSVVDLPCGAGRFWRTLLNAGALSITGVDRSAGMIQVCQEMTPSTVLPYLTLKQGDATSIPLPDKSADALICMRLLHHIHDRSLRIQMYKEFKRVARQTVCISFWVEGNYKSFRNQGRPGKNPYMPIKALEAELVAAGFSITGKVDMLKGYLPWRLYVLSI